MTSLGKSARIAALMAMAAPVWALAPAPLALAQEGESAGIGTVTVTARRRAESLQDTPIAVSAYSAESLERQQVNATTELDQITPNLQFTSYGTLTGNNSAAQVFIRGIGQTDATPAVDPGVGIYIDDVYMGRAVGGAMDFRDIANVQVLRGPQGTLFGRNTIGGAVLLTTNTPGDEFGGRVRVGIGEDNLREGFLALDLPLAEGLAARVSFGARQRDGYVTRVSDGLDLGDDNTWTAQGALRWEPSEALTLTLRADYTEEDENGSPFVFQSINETQAFVRAASAFAGCPGYAFGPPVPQTNDPRCGNDLQARGDFTNGGTAPAFSTLENSGVSLVAEWRVSDVLSFKSVTADRSLEWAGARDADNTPLTILDTRYASRSDQLSQELQMVIDTDRLDGVVGAYYFDEETFDRVNVNLAQPPGAIIGTRDSQRVNLDSEAWALFTEWTFGLTDALSVTGGLRYTEETKGFQGVLFNVSPLTAPEPPDPVGLCPIGTPTPGCLFVSRNRFEENFTALTGSASVSYRWSPALMTYVSYAQGFKSGGFNQRYNAAPPGNAPISFDEETADTWEIGFKSNFTDSLRLNGAVFSTTYDDIQLTYRLGVVPLLFNAGEATIDGAELELVFAPNEALLIDASLGILDTQFESIIPVPFPGVTATVGLANVLPFTPEMTAHIGASYGFTLGNGHVITPRVDLSYTDSQFFDAANSPEIAQTDSVSVINASVAWDNPDRNWRVTLGVNNATDELYRVAGTSSLTTAAGYAEIINARPRNWFLSVSADF